MKVVTDFIKVSPEQIDCWRITGVTPGGIIKFGFGRGMPPRNSKVFKTHTNTNFQEKVTHSYTNRPNFEQNHPIFPKFSWIWANFGKLTRAYTKFCILFIRGHANTKFCISFIRGHSYFKFCILFIRGRSYTKRLILLLMLAAHPCMVFCTEYPHHTYFLHTSSKFSKTVNEHIPN